MRNLREFLKRQPMLGCCPYLRLSLMKKESLKIRILTQLRRTLLKYYVKLWTQMTLPCLNSYLLMPSRAHNSLSTSK